MLAVLGAACLAGCSQTTADATRPGERGAINTGTFPNLNIEPRYATDQFNADSLQAHNDTVTAAVTEQRAQGADAGVAVASAQAEEARLRRLNASQGSDVLTTIERQRPVPTAPAATTPVKPVPTP